MMSSVHEKEEGGSLQQNCHVGLGYYTVDVTFTFWCASSIHFLPTIKEKFFIYLHRFWGCGIRLYGNLGTNHDNP